MPLFLYSGHLLTLANMGEIGRRQLLQGAALGAAGLGIAGLPIGMLSAQPVETSLIDPRLLARATSAVAKHGDKVFNQRVMGIADFSQPSGKPRFHLYNLIDGTTTTLLVSHGIGSDRDHSGWVQEFSNIPGSEATSSGAYLVGESYYGKYGMSRRLIGLDPENDQAESRAIVIHPAWYVSQEVADRQGKVGRSQGCFAFSFDDIGQVLWRLGPGTMLYADKV
jgi:hypothetical protein